MEINEKENAQLRRMSSKLQKHKEAALYLALFYYYTGELLLSQCLKTSQGLYQPFQQYLAAQTVWTNKVTYMAHSSGQSKHKQLLVI